MTSTLCLSVADIHGNKTQYEKIIDLVRQHDIKHVFMCGDLLPKDGGSWHPENTVRTIAMQAAFINDYFVDYLTRLGNITNVYAIFGNDDFIANYHLVEQRAIPNVTFLKNQVVKLADDHYDLSVAGYPYVGVTPFLHKDLERWDETPGVLPHKIHRTDGYISEGHEHLPVDLKDDQRTIAADLEQLATLSDPSRTIYVCHEAPFDTPLDQISLANKYIDGQQAHIGSHAMRQFIESRQPFMTMHGHIHEAFAESGDFMWRCGKSVSVTAANDFSSETLSYVLFSLGAPADAQRLQL